MATRIGVCNAALASIGARLLQSEEAPGAEPILVLYDQTARLVAGSKSWTAGRRSRRLNREDAGMDDGVFYKYSYSLPGDILGPPRGVYDNVDCPPITDFELNGDRILTDAENIYIKYQAQPDPANWSALYEECVILALAGKLAASPLREDDELAANFYRQVWGDARVPGALGLIAKAAAQDAQGAPSQFVASSGPLVNVRY